MPEFILNTHTAITGEHFRESKRHAAWKDCDAFTQGYIEAMFFTSCGDTCGDCESCLDESHMSCVSDSCGGRIKDDCGVMDIHESALESIKADCAKFQTEAEKLLSLVYEQAEDYGETEAGRDFWFSRGGHGVGYWSRDEKILCATPASWPQSIGDTLSDMARAYGESDLYEGDTGERALYVT